MTSTTAPTIQEQASTVLLPQLAGHVGSRTIAIGIRQGHVAMLAAAPDGLTADELAEGLGHDPFYTAVWCRGAVATGLVAPTPDGRHHLAPHMATLLLDQDAPAYVGGIFTVLEHPEVFDRFEDSLATGDRLWWDDCSAAFVANVAETGRPFYRRLVPEGLGRIPGLADRLRAPSRILDTACGSGLGAIRLAEHHPEAEVVGADGDAHSIEVARRAAREAGVDDQVSFVCTPLEELEVDGDFALVTNNISMHECRDIDRVTANVREVLEPGGWFVISDFPFPEEVDGLRTLPGRIMSGIQYFEAQIDDQLLPRATYDDLLDRHGFTDRGAFTLAPVHAVTHARA